MTQQIQTNVQNRLTQGALKVIPNGHARELEADSSRLTRVTRTTIVHLVSFSLVACGGGSDPTLASTPAAAPVPSPTPFSAPASTDSTVPQPRSQDHYRDVLAYASKVNIASVSDPTLPVHLAYASNMLAQGVAIDSPRISTAFAAATAAWSKEVGRTVGNPTQLTLLSITATRDHLATIVGAKAASLLMMKVQQDMLGKSSASAGRGLLISEDELGGKRRSDVYEEAVLRCTVNVNTTFACNSLFKARLSVDVDNAFAQTCTNSTESWCQVLSNPPATQSERDSRADTEIRKVTAAAISCASGSSGCKLATAKEEKAEQTKKHEEEAKKIENTGDNLAKYGQKYLGLSDENAAITQTIFSTGSKLYKNIYAASAAYETLRSVDLKQALTFNAILRGAIFEDKSNPKWIQGINFVEGIGGAIAAASGVVGAVLSVVKLFSGSSSKASAAQQQQAQQLLQALDAMRRQLSAQLVAIDSKLDSVLLLSSETLGAVFTSTNSLAQQTAAAQAGLAKLSEAVSALSYEAQGWAQDGAASFFVTVTGTEYKLTDFSQWKNQATSVKSWVTNIALDSTHAGPEGSFGDSYTELTRPGTAWINGLRYFPKAIGLQPLASSRVPSPSDTIGVLNRYFFGLVAIPQYRSFVEQSDTDIKRYASSVLETNIAPLEALRREIQFKTDLFPALARSYTNAVNELAIKQDQAVLTWMSVNGTAGNRDVSMLNPWAGGAQTLTNYNPRSMVTGSMPHCEGPSYGAPLSMPDWKKIVPESDPAVTADALGSSLLSICYRLTGTLAGGWTHYVWERINDDHKQAMGAFTVQVVVKLGNKLVAQRTVRAPASGDVCFADVPKSQVDTISAARPAMSVLAQAWDGTFSGGGVCNQAPIPSISKVRDAFNASPDQSVNWLTSDPISRADVLASNERAISELAVNVELYLADQTTLAGVPTADAARQLSGLKLALRRYIEFGFPSLWSTNDAVRAAFEGSTQIVDAAEVQRQLQAAAVSASSTTRPGKSVFAAEANARVDSLASLMSSYQSKIVSGEIIDKDVELTAVRMQLEAIIGSLE